MRALIAAALLMLAGALLACGRGPAPFPDDGTCEGLRLGGICYPTGGTGS